MGLYIAEDKKSKGRSRTKTYEQNKQQQEAQNALNATQAMKKDREIFRKALVDIIMWVAYNTICQPLIYVFKNLVGIAG